MIEFDNADAPVLNTMKRMYSKKYGLVDTMRNLELGFFSVTRNSNIYSVGSIIPMYRCVVAAKNAQYLIGNGASLSEKRSAVKAFGEFIERYCAMQFSEVLKSKLQKVSYNDLCKTGVALTDMKDYLTFEETQYNLEAFPLERYSRSDSISWIQCINICDNTRTLVPVQKVLLIHPHVLQEKVYMLNTSTGLACGSTVSQATFSAICEVIERDSFMLTWLFKIPGVKIVMDEIQNRELQKLYAHICNYLSGEDSLHIYDISQTSGVYTVLTVIRNDLPKACGLVVSASAHVDPEIAILKSLEELCQTQSFLQASLVEFGTNKYFEMAPQDIDTLEKHALYYNTGIRSENLDFIDRGSKTVCISQLIKSFQELPAKGLDYIVALFKKRELQILISDLTTPDIEELGFSVIRAIVPEYLDLEVSHLARHSRSKRIDDYRRIYGEVLNDEPHPFP